MKPILVFATVLAWLPAASHAQDAAARTNAYRAGVSQSTLAGNASRVKDDLSSLIRDYERYDIAAMEIARLKESVAALQQLSGRDMPDAAKWLMLSAQENSGGNLTKAAALQKEIQTKLRSLSDELGRYSDQAAMQIRIEELAVRQLANQRATRQAADRLAEFGLTLQQLENEVAALPEYPERPAREDEEGRRVFEENRRKLEFWNDWSRQKYEQNALDRETHLAVEAMFKVADDPLAPAAAHFKQAIAAARSGQFQEHTTAATSAMDKDPRAAATEQQAVMDSFHAMIASLDAASSDEERLRDMSTQFTDLSAKENGIANRTPRMWGEQKNRATQDQFSIGDRLEILQNRLRALNPNASAKSRDAGLKANDLATPMRSENFTDDIPLVSRTADGQKALAKDLAEMGETLEKQAEKLSAAGQSAPQPEAISPEAAAIQDAMRELVDSRINVELATRQNSEKLDFQPRLEQGRRNLASGTQRARDAGPVVGEEVHKALAEADALAQRAANNDKTNHNLFHTRRLINEALTGLQEAAIKLAAQEEQKQQQDGGGNTTMKGGGPVIASQGERSDAQRDALSLLKQEKTAPEFETMVRQYIKNLAEEKGTEP